MIFVNTPDQRAAGPRATYCIKVKGIVSKKKGKIQALSVFFFLPQEVLLE